MICLVVHLLAHDGKEQLLTEFEDQALAILREHGATVAFRLRPSHGPTEIHVITVSDRSTLDRYRADPRLQELALMRDQAIKKTEIFESNLYDCSGLIE
jgi:hypothetical protein